MVLLAKGSSLIIIGLTIACILSTIYAQQEAPVVFSATPVSVVGGRIRIYGLHFGTEPSLIKVQIMETGAAIINPFAPHTLEAPANSVQECLNVELVAPETVIACQIAHVGTGKSKHIVVTTTKGGESISNVYDENAAFNRQAPELQTLTYNVPEKTIVVSGSNFGFDMASVSVALDGVDYPIVSADNSALTLRLLKKRRQQEYEIPESRYVYVTVDGQSSAANMSVALAAIQQPVEPEHDPVLVIENTGAKKGLDTNAIAGIVVGGVFTIALISLAATLFVMNKHKGRVFKKEVSNSDNKPDAPARSTRLGDAQISLAREKSEPQLSASSANVPAPFISSILKESSSTNVLSTSSPSIHAVIRTPAEGELSDTPTHKSNKSNLSLEEIDLHADHTSNLYERNVEVLSDSSFSESSSEDVSDAEEEEAEHSSSSFSAEFSSDTSPVSSPSRARRQQLQMSSEFPPQMFMPQSLRIVEHSPSPSPPTITRTKIGSSSLRNSMVIPPPLELSPATTSRETSLENSPLPSPGPSSKIPSSESDTASFKKDRRAKRPAARGRGGKGRGMIRAPSSRLGAAATMSSVHAAFDSPVM